MTHSLHRFGAKEDLKRDYVILAMPSKGNTDVGSAPKIKKHLSICNKHHPICLGGQKVGNSCLITAEELINNARDIVSTYNGVFSVKEAVRDILKEEIEAQVGLSIVISGVYDEVKDIADSLGIKTHTVNFSLGIWGKTELLPEPEILEITTLCGHGLISQHLVRHYFEKVSKGYSAQKAAKEIGALCYCSICNLERIAEILEKGLNLKKGKSDI
jgi:hypothetical protein